MDVVEVRWGCVDWIGLAQDRDRWIALVNTLLEENLIGKVLENVISYLLPTCFTRFSHPVCLSSM
jgi:hypothetical protein